MTVPNGTTNEQIIEKLALLYADYDAKEYARNRRPENSPIVEQLDVLFNAGESPDDMAAKLKAVKYLYPKP